MQEAIQKGRKWEVAAVSSSRAPKRIKTKGDNVEFSSARHTSQPNPLPPTDFTYVGFSQKRGGRQMKRQPLLLVLVITVILIIPSSLPINKAVATDSPLSVDSVEWGYVRTGLWAYIKSKVTITLTNHGSTDISIAKIAVNGSFLYEKVIDDTLRSKETKAYEIIFLIKEETMDTGDPLYVIRLTTYLIWQWNAEYTITILTPEGSSVSETCLTPR